jgi:hypothetical protein
MLADAMQKREQQRRSFFHGKVLHCTRRSALDDQGTSNKENTTLTMNQKVASVCS